MTLSDVIRWNTGITNIQDNVFFDRSVLIFEAPERGANISVVADRGIVTIINNDTGRTIESRSLASISQVILVGSNTSADVFNLFLGSANGGIEDGVAVYGGGSDGDRLNVFGRPFNTRHVHRRRRRPCPTTSRRPPTRMSSWSDRSTPDRSDLNGNNIFGTGFETLRLVTLGGNDTILDPGDFARVVNFWDPQRDD